MADSDDEDDGRQDDDNRNIYEKEYEKGDDNDDAYENATSSKPRANMVKLKSSLEYTDDEKLTDPNWEV